LRLPTIRKMVKDLLDKNSRVGKNLQVINIKGD